MIAAQEAPDSAGVFEGDAQTLGALMDALREIGRVDAEGGPLIIGDAEILSAWPGSGATHLIPGIAGWRTW